MAKTDVLWCASSRRQHQIPDEPLRVGLTCLARPVCSKSRYPTILLDSDLPMNSHHANCFLLFCCSVTSCSRSSCLVISRLDYGSATLAGLPAFQLDRLQSVSNAATRLIYRSRKFAHVTPLLHDLHRLRIPEQTTLSEWTCTTVPC